MDAARGSGAVAGAMMIVPSGAGCNRHGCAWRGVRAGTIRGGEAMTCYTLLVASPVPDDLTVTADDCTVIYNDMAVPGDVTVSVSRAARCWTAGSGSLPCFRRWFWRDRHGSCGETTMIKSAQSVTVDFTTVSPVTARRPMRPARQSARWLSWNGQRRERDEVTNKATGVYKAAVTLPA